MFNDPLIDGHENQAYFEAEIQAEAVSGLPQLTPEQITQLTNDPQIKATIEANKAQAQGKRESDLMLLGYNQALHDCANWPEGHTAQSWNDVIDRQKAKLDIF
jgi:hypothetical protein